MPGHGGSHLYSQHLEVAGAQVHPQLVISYPASPPQEITASVINILFWICCARVREVCGVWDAVQLVGRLHEQSPGIHALHFLNLVSGLSL